MDIIRPELLPTRIPARGAITLLDPLLDLGTRMASFAMMYGITRAFAAATGGVARFLTFDEVALGVWGRGAVVRLEFVVGWSTAGRVAGVLSLDDEVARGMGGSGGLSVVRFMVECEVAGVLSLEDGAWGVVLRAVMGVCITVGEVARLLPGDQGTGFALRDGLREGERKRCHQGE